MRLLPASVVSPSTHSLLVCFRSFMRETCSAICSPISPVRLRCRCSSSSRHARRSPCCTVQLLSTGTNPHARKEPNDQDFFAVALPPLRPAAFFCAVVPPWLELLFDELDEPDFLPPRLDAPGELAIFAARSFDTRHVRSLLSH